MGADNEDRVTGEPWIGAGMDGCKVHLARKIFHSRFFWFGKPRRSFTIANSSDSLEH
jgi:hypothetical protein